MATYRIGVIGHTGSGNYGHGIDTVWRSIDGAEIAATADADAGGLNAAGERLGVPQESRYRRLSTDAQQRGAGLRERLPALGGRAQGDGRRRR